MSREEMVGALVTALAGSTAVVPTILRYYIRGIVDEAVRDIKDSIKETIKSHVQELHTGGKS